MMFTVETKTELAKPLDKKFVKPPALGRYGEYVEGWHVINEANRIFGFDGWSRETVEMVEVCRAETKIGKAQDAGWMVGYRAKVRITVYGTATGSREEIVREGSAVGNGEARKLYDAIESAVKEAETDAMKRAMMTLGYPFGLALYDKNKEFVTDGKTPALISPAQFTELSSLALAAGVSLPAICKRYEIDALVELPADWFDVVKESLTSTLNSKTQKGQ